MMMTRIYNNFSPPSASVAQDLLDASVAESSSDNSVAAGSLAHADQAVSTRPRILTLSELTRFWPPITSMRLGEVPQTNSPSAVEAGSLPFFLAQIARHLGPVTGSRTLAQGLLGPALANLVQTHPHIATTLQGALTICTSARALISMAHTNRAGVAADNAFCGFNEETTGLSNRRQVWQTVQRLGILCADVLCVASTATSIVKPNLIPVAQQLACLQVRAHFLSQGREFLRPIINTVHVGSANPGIPMPDTGRTLRSVDIGPQMKVKYGGGVAVCEFVSQLLMHNALGGKQAWQSGLQLATAAGAISGLANTISSSLEDYLIDNAAARRMQETDASHVRKIHLSFGNPLSWRELGRQLERVDARVFNQMVPGLLSVSLSYGLKQLSDPRIAGSTPYIGALLISIINAVVLGSLLTVTAQTYQLNDTLRARN